MTTTPSRVHSPEALPAATSLDFRSVFESEFDYVCRALRRLGVNAADLKDVSQELFLAVHRQLGSFDASRPIRPWLFGFALRFAANHRRLARGRDHVSIDQKVKYSPSEQRDASVEARDLVLRALEALPFDRRVAIVMHDLEGWAAPDIADQLGIPLGTVYSRIRIGRTDFRDAVTRLSTEGGDR
jgi:RNA polymerase sigma-70 factor (ECF subfamily)